MKTRNIVIVLVLLLVAYLINYSLKHDRKLNAGLKNAKENGRDIATTISLVKDGKTFSFKSYKLGVVHGFTCLILDTVGVKNSIYELGRQPVTGLSVMINGKIYNELRTCVVLYTEIPYIPINHFNLGLNDCDSITLQ